ncbi:hypothetical protein EJB05_42984, partial [Eragrostis curvula]
MWDGGVEHHGAQDAAPHQLLPPWLGGAVAPFADPAAFGGAGYASSCDVFGGLAAGLGHGGVFGFGFDAAAAMQQQRNQAADVGSGSGGKAVVSGLLGSLQAELGRMTAREMMDAKALAASRSHSEAERRRRQRINGHLAKLRSLLPNTTKTDKASLLAEVLDHVKELKRQTSAMMAAVTGGDEDDAAAGPVQLLPTEADELAVDAAVDGAGRLVVRASLCCEDRADLIPDIVRALAALRMRARRAEITTLGGRVRSVLLITAGDGGAREEVGDDDDDEEEDVRAATSHRRHECIASVQEALRGVMDRRGASSDTSSSGGGGGSMKRQRMNYGVQEQCSV